MPGNVDPAAAAAPGLAAPPRQRTVDVLGLVDGITNALGLASHSVLHGGAGGLGLALRIAFFALATAVFAVFVARYVELRTNLIQAGKQLNLLERGTLATTRLGRAARLDALADAAQASVASFSGALLPLALAVAFPSSAGFRWPSHCSC